MGKVEKSLILDSYIRRRKSNQNTEIDEKTKKRETLRRVSKILRKSEADRSADEKLHLINCNPDIVKQIQKRKNRVEQSKERILEIEDPYETIDKKAKKLADILSRARHLVCYTGAGISTSACIPDYRGSQGIWTLLQKGETIGQHDLSLAEPTYTHMSLFELHRRNILRYVLSQNCDGLHLRSGLPRTSLSEIHGNMYVEVCKQCKPNSEYWRLFDTTESTARYNHKTNRRCQICNNPLVDTIVHFGERGSIRWPLNWDGACKHAEKADVILCLGSSLKVLKKYSWLWAMDRPKNKRPKIYIINLQWTPKDSIAAMKINGKCDEVMALVMKYMNIQVPVYCRKRDPIFAHASRLAIEEYHTVTQPMLKSYRELKAIEKKTEQQQKIITTVTSSKSIIVENFNKSINNHNKNNIDEFKINNQSVKIETNIKEENLNDSKEHNQHITEIQSEKFVETVKEIFVKKDELIKNVKIESQNDCTVNNNDNDQYLEKKNNSLCEISEKNINITKNKEEILDKLMLETIITNDTNINNSENLILPKDQLENEQRNKIIDCQSLPHSISSTISKQIPPLCYTNEYTVKIKQQEQDQPLDNNEIQQFFCDNRNLSDNLLRKSPSLVSFKPPPQITTPSSSLTLATQNLLSSDLSRRRPPRPPVPISQLPTVRTGVLTLSPRRRMLPSIIQSDDCDSVSKTMKKKFIQFDKNDNDNGNEDDDNHDDEDVDAKQLNEHDKAYNYQNLFGYYKVIGSGKLPHWYDVNYAYSGLHSIIHPPPTEVDLWGTIIIPIFQLNRKQAECEFCFDNYAEYNCQFYKTRRRPQFQLAKRNRLGKLILCECCDFDEDDLSLADLRDSCGVVRKCPSNGLANKSQNLNGKNDKNCSVSVGGGVDINDDDDDDDDVGEEDDDEDEVVGDYDDDDDSEQHSDEKRAKLNITDEDNEDDDEDDDDIDDDGDTARSSSGSGGFGEYSGVNHSNGIAIKTGKKKIQPGWYGKGYRKLFRRKRR